MVWEEIDNKTENLEIKIMSHNKYVGMMRKAVELAHGGKYSRNHRGAVGGGARGASAPTEI